jgi:hypothetical protein
MVMPTSRYLTLFGFNAGRATGAGRIEYTHADTNCDTTPKNTAASIQSPDAHWRAWTCIFRLLKSYSNRTSVTQMVQLQIGARQ